ncbi:hypothetical protein CDD81_1244 [Ophiocordyceps australis]|uniref:Uncharacterized protein n=1 Tax=Ophiocordyceps australis TaxID=1399860 RepID=A0A2C5Y8R8_9HYPO|nr:hypothetical protein CDD81_1244 [Ophiocordyceps australis]
MQPKPAGKTEIRMDPNCAICQAPAIMACDCEAKGLEVAVRQAEERMMRSIYADIRAWVRAHAQDYVLEYFRLLADRRKTAHTTHLEQMAHDAYYRYNAPPHPSHIADAQALLKRGIDEDWQASVQRYPEVLEYYFALVELVLPADDDAAVKDPPLSALSGNRKATRRIADVPSSSSSGASPFAALNPQPGLYADHHDMPMERRAPAPRREQRPLSSRLPAAHPSPFYPYHT